MYFTSLLRRYDKEAKIKPGLRDLRDLVVNESQKTVNSKTISA